MKRIYSIANQKGGTGKTAATYNLAAGLVKRGKKTVAIDLDPQGNLSARFGYKPAGGLSMSDVIYREVAGQQYGAEIFQTNQESGVDYVPANKMLAGAPGIMAMDNASQEVIRRIISRPIFQAYDVILIDCPPSLDLLVCNALTASSGIIIPVQAQTDAYEAIKETLHTVKKIQTTVNPELHVAGILLTMYRKQTSLSNDIYSKLRQNYNQVFHTPISFLTEEDRSRTQGTSLVNMRSCQLGEEYLRITDELLQWEAIA